MTMVHKCDCGRHDDDELGGEGVRYKVIPYTYSRGGLGREGVMYQIVQQRFMANAKHERDADFIVEQLNKVRKLERELERVRSAATSVEYVRQAMIKEVCALPHHRWSAHRKEIIDFGKSVLRRLGLGGNHEIDPNNL